MSKTTMTNRHPHDEDDDDDDGDVPIGDIRFGGMTPDRTLSNYARQSTMLGCFAVRGIQSRTSALIGNIFLLVNRKLRSIAKILCVLANIPQCDLVVYSD